MRTTYKQLFALFGKLKSLNGVEESAIVDGKHVTTFTAFDLDCSAIVAIARNMTIIHAHLDNYNTERAALVANCKSDWKLKEAIEALLTADIDLPKLHTVKLSALRPAKNPKLQVGLLSDLIRDGHIVDDMPIETETEEKK